MPTYHLLIKGRVQGVFYRATAKEVAKNLGIRGWIKNTNDGNVEAVVTGTELLMQNFIAWCRSGPKEAQVNDVLITEQPETEFEKFTIDH
jgi:acylphosphatase